MGAFSYHGHGLCVEGVPLKDIALQFGTPCYVYSKKALLTQIEAYQNALKKLPHLICYAVKANGNLSLLQLIHEAGLGFDVVSGGEFLRAQKAGASGDKIVFAGVGKTAAELAQALEAGVYCINVESEAELLRLAQVAQNLKVVAPFALRVNPDVDPKTHPYISTGLKGNKFGIAMTEAQSLYVKTKNHPHLKAMGVACHIGSQITDLAPFIEAQKKVLQLVAELKTEGLKLTHIDMGGGLGVPYQDEAVPSVADYLAALVQPLLGTDLKLIVEPGRSLVAQAGVLVTKVEYIKHNADKTFVVTDAAMNDYLRPALYGAKQKIVNVVKNTTPTFKADIVGPVCESADCFLKDAEIAVQEGNLLAICDVGAYGFSMASQYNSRPRPPEVLVDGTNVTPIRARETLDSLLENELRLLKEISA